MAEQAATSGASVFSAAQSELQARAARLVRVAVQNPALLISLPGQLQREADYIAGLVGAKVPPLVRATVTPAAKAGAASVTVPPMPRSWYAFVPELGTGAAARIASDLQSQLTAAAQRITRFANDAYRAATAEASIRQVALRYAPREAQQNAWRDLMGRGITGFQDSDGKQWNLASYVEMAVRTATARAYRDAQADRMGQLGVPFYTISHDGRPCKRCAPWEGKVLGSMGAGTFEFGGDTVTVDGTVDEAVAEGLFHPNCMHTLLAYVPGTTPLNTTPWTDAQEAAYLAAQRQRDLERRLRAAKAQRDNALDLSDRAAARRKVAQLNQQLDAHVAANGLGRVAHRERPNLGFTQ